MQDTSGPESQRLPPETARDSDPLHETLYSFRLNGSLYCRADLLSPWGIEVPAFEDMMTFTIVIEGHAWLAIDGEEPRLLEPNRSFPGVVD